MTVLCHKIYQRPHAYWYCRRWCIGRCQAGFQWRRCNPWLSMSGKWSIEVAFLSTTYMKRPSVTVECIIIRQAMIWSARPPATAAPATLLPVMKLELLQTPGVLPFSVPKVALVVDCVASAGQGRRKLYSMKAFVASSIFHLCLMVTACFAASLADLAAGQYGCQRDTGYCQ